MKIGRVPLFAGILMFSFFFIPSTHADRCILPITDVDVYGPGQKAIIAWNGVTERLILSTDLYASVDTNVLEILPLPSEPTVEGGSFESFEAVQRLMIENRPQLATPEELGKGLEIVFHERIGTHDITVVRATSVEELLRFMLSYTQRMNIPHAPPIREKTRLILEDYLARDCNYWVFDLVDLYSSPRSIEPIIYEFQTQSLYYPLKVSATAEGDTEIILYLITPDSISEDTIPPKMRIARYLPSDQIIQFQLTQDDLAMIDKGITSLFGPRPLAEVPSTSRSPLVYPPFSVAWFTAIKYEGPLSDLDFDLEIPLHPVPSHSIKVNTGKYQCNLGEVVEITVDFTHLRTKFFEIEVLHSHQIRLEIFDLSGVLIQSWQWITNDDLHETVAWKPNRADSYSVRASSWCNGEKLEVRDQTTMTILSQLPYLPPILSRLEVRWLIYGVIIAVACMLIGAGVAYLLLRSRLR